jgi:hypothetical protein
MNEESPEMDDVPIELSGHLRLAVDTVRAEPIPVVAQERALERARGVRPLPDVRGRRFFRRRLLAVAGLAAGVLVGAGIWMIRPTHSWADVAQAVRAKHWLHLRRQEVSGVDSETWLSPKHGITATRYGRQYEHFDHRLRVYHTYDADEGTVYRLPKYRGARRDAFLSMLDIVDALFRAEASPRMAAMMVRGVNDAMCKVLSERQLDVRDEQGRTWREYEMSIEYPQVADPVHIVIRVDPKSNLPQSVRGEGKFNGQAVATEELFDYPEKGPADIYAMGVPRSAKLVDRIPRGDLARLLDGVKAARQRFDDYAAIVVESSDKEPWWKGKPIRVWRKGRKWRYDSPLGFVYISNAKPGPGADMGRWWQDRLKGLHWQPLMAGDGKTNFWFEGKAVQARESKDWAFKVTAVKRTPETAAEDDYIPAAYSFMPEYLSHPPMGIPASNSEPVIETNPRDGPPGTVLLRVRHRVTAAEAKAMKDAHLPPMPDLYRFWIDPSKSYLTMRWQTGETKATKSADDVFIMEGLARSPSGGWYPTAVRRLDAIRNMDGTVYGDQVFRFFLQFNVVLPDSLFDGRGTEVEP